MPETEIASAERLFDRGNRALASGSWTEAADAFRRAAERLPDAVPIRFNLGMALDAMGRSLEAEDAFRRCLDLNPALEAAWTALILSAKRRADFVAALQLGRGAIVMNPSHYEALTNTADTAIQAGHSALATTFARRAIAARAEWSAWCALGVAHTLQGQVDRAETALRRSIALAPGRFEGHNNLAAAMPEIDRVLSGYRRAMAVEPGNSTTHSNFIFAMLYSGATTVETLFEEARRWKMAHAPARPRFRHAPCAGDAERRLRLGYISSDLRQHPIAYNVEDLLRHHDRSGFEVSIYSGVAAPDDVSRRIQRHADRWRPIAAMSSGQVADLVNRDGIDILVVLAAHVGANHLTVAAERPAPVQISFHDVVTSGVDVIDAWISDPILHPEGLPERFVERVVHVPSYFLYRPPDRSPDIGPLPAERRGYLTFGSCNNPLKLQPDVWRLWARVLARHPRSRLLLKYKDRFSSRRMQRWVGDRLAHCGIGIDRVDFVGGNLGRYDQLAVLNDIDIALDPFPFNGATTTYEALWMGVPVVTMAGNRHSARVGASLLHQVGLDRLVAMDEPSFMRITDELASDLPLLSRLRTSLRRTVEDSPLSDAKTYARHIEAVYRHLWRDWCRGRRV
jgi:predicted O-linked N-acetylglucosamine transferase (SPINDLY family)